MKIGITVPGHLTNNHTVEDKLDALMQLAGGVTICPAQGRWRDPAGNLVIEPVEQYHFGFAGGREYHDWAAINHAERAVAGALLWLGEQAVLVERLGQGCTVQLYTMKDFQ